MQLPDYQELRNCLEAQYKATCKVSGPIEESGPVRSLELATELLDFLETHQTKLFEFFKAWPSLQYLYDQQYGAFKQFIETESIINTLFFEQYLYPEIELYPLEPEEESEVIDLKSYLKDFETYLADLQQAHQETQKLIRENFDIQIKQKSLPCQCHQCQADYRTRLRDTVFDECKDLIEKYQKDLLESMHLDIDQVAGIYFKLLKSIDKILYRVRFRLRRVSLKKLDIQIKTILKETFHYPSNMAVDYVELIKPFFENYLREQNLRRDLVNEEQYERFFTQLGKNLWREERFLLREFKQLVQSVMALMRKDISAGILKDYLGEFWIHSNARNIKRKIIYHMGPTNSGKTYHAIESLCQAISGCYLAPLRLLAAELYDTMNSKGVATSLLTGEEVVEIDNATHYSSTIEMAKFNQFFECSVIDEIQMISDTQRGWAWTRALVNLNSPLIHVCGDGSVLDLIQKIADLCGDELEIKNYERMTDLQVEKDPITVADLDRYDALIVFSRRNALKYKYSLEQLGLKVSIVYGRLSPEVRREQARKFDRGETDVMVSTDAIAMGMNLPIRRIVFSTLSKYIDSKEIKITDSEIKQIAGRAGRFNRFPTGFVTTLKKVEEGISSVNKAIYSDLAQKTRCMVGPDLDIYMKVNKALKGQALPELKLSEFLRLFNTMSFKKPFYCVDLKEMIELAEMVDDADKLDNMSVAEIFGFACAPVNLGLVEHVQFYVWILSNFAHGKAIKNELINTESDDIDYLETSIKCVELYQWLARHFKDKFFEYDDIHLLDNKTKAVEKLNDLLSDKIVLSCSSCGVKLPENTEFAICEECFEKRKFRRRRSNQRRGIKKTGQSASRSGNGGNRKKSGGKKNFRSNRRRGFRPKTENSSKSKDS